jgi:hypothetical protein
MGWYDSFIRLLACLLLIPLVGAALAYLRRRFAGAMLWNGSLPLVVMCASILLMLVNQTQVTAGGLLYAIPPVLSLAVCAAGYLRRSRHPLLFWFPWFLNLAMVAFFFYLAFWFHISF